MSLILEALKKSEANRRLGEAPDLGTPFTTTARRRSPLPFVVVAIVIASGAGWWLLRTPPVAEQATPVQNVADVSAPSKAEPRLSKPAAPVVHPAHRPLSASDVHMPIGQSAGAPVAATANTGPTAPPTTVASAPVVARPPALPVAMAGKPNAAVATPAPGMKKTEAASRKDATVVVAAPPPLPAGAGKIPAPAPAAGNALSGMAAPPSGLKKPETLPPHAPAEERRNPAPVATPNVATDAGKAAVANDAAAAPERRGPAPDAGSAPPYNELAFSTRKDLPPIKLSMHVYAADPAQRFVILNDSRMLEGDSQDDLSVREIRPDGVVFEFRGQRFFYPRDGL